MHVSISKYMYIHLKKERERERELRRGPVISCSTRWQMALDCNPPRTKCRARYSSGDSPFEMERPYRHYPTIERDKYKWMFKRSFVLYLVGWRGRERERKTRRPFDRTAASNWVFARRMHNPAGA